MTSTKTVTDENFQLFRSSDLVPSAWKRTIAAAPDHDAATDSETDAEGAAKPGRIKFRVFNPTMVATDQGYALAYRVVDEEHNIRRLATCRLTKNLKVVRNSVTPLSDIVTFASRSELNERALTWHADPRYFRLGGKIYMLWNDGANKPENHQFLQEMSEDGLRPVGPAREVVTDLERRSVEKNWMFFENDKGVWAIYAIYPHHVLAVDLSDPDVVTCKNASESLWDSEYNQFYGVLRGSAQPIRHGEDFLTIAHSSYKTTKGRIYQACFYKFDLESPFKVTQASRRPFEVPNPIGDHFSMPRLNPEVHKVVYPCGFVQADDKLLISFGINDELCAVATVGLQDVLESMSPVDRPASATVPATVATVPATVAPAAASPAKANGKADVSLPVFWWNAAGKKFDGQFGNRNFKIGNFGDIAAAETVERLTGGRVRVPGKDERKILTIGSVLHTARDGDIVWGTGAKGTKMELDPSVKHLHAYACRGPLTLGVLLRSGIDISKIRHFFDPGCLVPRLYAKEIAAWKASPNYRPGGIRVVPHYRDDLLFRREYPEYSDSFVSVDCTPLGMVEALLGADVVVSSSLHGVIFAEALGIPAYWHVPIGGEDDLKFYDYYYGTGRHQVKRFDTLHEALRAEPMELPKLDFDAYLDTFPEGEMMVLSGRKPAAGKSAAAPKPVAQAKPQPEPQPAPVLPPPVREDKAANGALTLVAAAPKPQIEYENFLPSSADGSWGFGNQSEIRTTVPDTESGKRVIVALQLKPFNPALFRRPQSVRILVNGSYAATAEWPRGNETALDLRLAVQTNHDKTPIALTFQARNARTPRSLAQPSHPLASHQISFCVKDLTVLPG
ncbi:polysaccharide pyruvyl transferase family protein [Labrys wisconsinensis]|uniref:GH43/DUF377 family glycosyl hydrolase n=1 Tax=Labrys wisconsinensis TaxID=425677 RepID=A0ABU0IYU7_9HYPH|nr:polysaccharide pyruvyl transferase family protein [Labrys wisconsinensis]MDQ0467179.1 putative GH43/DUF377 family glycosyl hydrolase [Labrys wisconsinensis]